MLEIRPGHRYEGAWKSGRPDGHGKCNYPDGTVYEGEFSNGVPHGKGSRTWADGSTEVGEFAEGKVHGKGKTVNDEGDIFEGNFSDGIPNGQGEFKFADGDWFLGIVQNGLPLDGQCKQSVETDGQFGDAFFEYEGAVSAGVWNGQGRLTLYDKRSKLATRKREEQYKLYTYEGEFKNGKFHGKGKKVQIRDSDGGEGFHPGIGSWEYEGEWRNDDMSGQGKLTYTRSGSVYQGSFKSGKPHGQGTFKGGDGQYKEGTWSHGQFREGKIKMRWEDGRVYEGGMVDAEMEGHGTMEWPNGDKLEGNFEKGLFPEYALLVTGKGVKRNVVLEEGFLQNLTGRRADMGVLPSYVIRPDAS